MLRPFTYCLLEVDFSRDRLPSTLCSQYNRAQGTAYLSMLGTRYSRRIHRNRTTTLSQANRRSWQRCQPNFASWFFRLRGHDTCFYVDTRTSRYHLYALDDRIGWARRADRGLEDSFRRQSYSIEASRDFVQLFVVLIVYMCISAGDLLTRLPKLSHRSLPQQPVQAVGIISARL
jgi:hypothetical protein